MLSVYPMTRVKIKKAGFDNIYSFINQNKYHRITNEYSSSQPPFKDWHIMFANTSQIYLLYMVTVSSHWQAPSLVLWIIFLSHILKVESVLALLMSLFDMPDYKVVSYSFCIQQWSSQSSDPNGRNSKFHFRDRLPDIDVMLSDQLPEIDAVREKYSINFREYGIFIYHPVTTGKYKIWQGISKKL